MDDIRTLIAQREALDQQIRQRQAALRAQIIDDIKKQIRMHGITPAELGVGSHKVKPRVIAANYKDPLTGAVWPGRGPRPAWLKERLKAGATLADMLLTS